MDTDTALDPAGRTSLQLLLEEATRQLDVCNACRYCEGYCAVYPALSRRSLLNAGDVSQLANLCHDCRACFDACMYTVPHEFDLNIPKVLAEVRVSGYRRYVWPHRIPRVLSGWTGVFAGAVVSVLVVFVAALVHRGWFGLFGAHPTAASPYALVPYPLLLALMLAPAGYAAAVLGLAGRRFWQETAPASDRRLTANAVVRAVGYAATLRYLRGGGEECYYPDDERPSPARRIWHSLVAYGFGLCLVSTLAAGIEQDFLGMDPPYPWLSVPVVSGVIGGAGLAAGCVGLLVLKVNSSKITSFRQMTIKDYGFLTALLFLALTGLATLFTRTTAAYGLVLLVHLAAIGLCFAAAPYTKFAHLVYRFLAIVRDNLEQR